MIKKNAGFFISLIFGIIGICFFVIGIIFLIFNINFKNNSVKHTAIISDISKSNNNNNTVYVTYTFNGHEYTEQLNFYSSSMSIGDETTIYVNPKSPNEIESKYSGLLPIIFLAIGLIFLIISIVFIILRIKKRKSNEKLLTDGMKVYVEISEITINTSLSMNGRHPFVIICTWMDPSTNLFYSYRSGNMWVNPKPILKAKGITSLPVYIDKTNPKKYFVSLNDIEKFLGN